MSKIEHQVVEAENGERLDKLITGINSEWSRSQAQLWIRERQVMVNGQFGKPNYRCKIDDLISIEIPEPEQLLVEAEKLALEIVFEDQDILVVNKPKGMVVHPAPGHSTGTLVNGLLAHCKELSTLNGPMRPGIVHRIDKDTSGLLMVAKNNQAHEHLVSQLVEKSVTRKYLALVHGVIQHEHGTIDAPIGRDVVERKSMTITEKGKQAVTHFSVLETFDQYTFVECVLETGRTHQIRVHMKYIGFPVAGDPKYGPRKTLDVGGQVLHAGVLGIHSP